MYHICYWKKRENGIEDYMDIDIFEYELRETIISIEEKGDVIVRIDRY